MPLANASTLVLSYTLSSQRLSNMITATAHSTRSVATVFHDEHPHNVRGFALQYQCTSRGYLERNFPEHHSRCAHASLIIGQIKYSLNPPRLHTPLLVTHHPTPPPLPLTLVLTSIVRASRSMRILRVRRSGPNPAPFRPTPKNTALAPFIDISNRQDALSIVPLQRKGFARQCFHE